jgi:hypothetical protein
VAGGVQRGAPLQLRRQLRPHLEQPAHGGLAPPARRAAKGLLRGDAVAAGGDVGVQLPRPLPVLRLLVHLVQQVALAVGGGAARRRARQLRLGVAQLGAGRAQGGAHGRHLPLRGVHLVLLHHLGQLQHRDLAVDQRLRVADGRLVLELVEALQAAQRALRPRRRRVLGARGGTGRRRGRRRRRRRQGGVCRQVCEEVGGLRP